MISISYDKTINTVIGSQRGLEIVVAAWDLFRSHGWATRSNREVVSDPIYAEVAVDGEGQVFKPGEKMVPSLYEVCAWNAYASSTAEWREDNPFKLEITDDVRRRAEEVRDAVINDHVMKILSEQGSDFQKRVNEILTKQSIKVSELKSLAYVVPMASDISRNQLMEEKFFDAQPTHIGAIGHKITAVVTVLSVRFSREFSIWNHTAITDDKHVVTFFNKKEFKDGTRMRITANVKDHRTMYKRPNVAETRLNYVKVLDNPA